MTESALPDTARYSFGADEFLLVEVAPAMSLEAHIRAMAISQAVREANIDGITELCPSNASLLIRFDPDVIHPYTLRDRVQELEAECTGGTPPKIRSRIIEVPVWYGDSYTTEVMKRFREGFHQDPSGTDLEYAAKVNGFDSVDAFVRAHHEQPWLVSMVGFVAGLPWLYQLVGREKQLEVPKYLSPRSGGTPQLTLGHGGCFGAVYSVEGAGGYQMLGLLVGPIFDAAQTTPDFRDSMVFFNPGDVVKYRSIDEAEYRELRAQVEAGEFRYRTAPIEFDTALALSDTENYNKTLVEALNGA